MTVPGRSETDLAVNIRKATSIGGSSRKPLELSNQYVAIEESAPKSMSP